MITLIITLIIVGVIVYIGQALIPMDPTIKKVVLALIFLCVFLYVMEGFGYFASLPAWGHHK